MAEKNEIISASDTPVSLQMSGENSVGIGVVTGGELHLHAQNITMAGTAAENDIVFVSSIVVPERLTRFLGKNKDFHVWLDYVSQFFSDSPHYYSEYGGHGVEHINETLKYIDALIPTERSLNSDATMFLVAGVVIHDIGRQLTHSGFIKLMQLPSWLDRWKEYHSRACRFSDAEQINRYGETINILLNFPKNNEIPEESAKVKLIVSDFIREWHGLIVYDATVSNVDFSSGKKLFNYSLSKDYIDLIGRIAQSHKMALREVEPLLANSRYGGINAKMPFGVPVFYLMALLRLADFFDAKAQHTPFQRKWILPQENHNPEQLTFKQVVQSITFPPNSPQHDSAYIEAYPSNTRTFVITKEWIEAIQRELDYSWAVLSEKNKSEFALSIHRVFSNITNKNSEAAFQKDFVTQKPYLKADTNILKHLIAPLYGGDASYGVRELTANAVDAVNERFFISNTQNHQHYPRRNSDIKSIIEISIDKGENFENDGRYKFTITDRGIGMTLDVILNYYLTSGVSFRESEEWKRLFDIGKKTKITRTGRFGVGALSAFLLGDSITVTTRHMDEQEKGYKFSFSLCSEIINIERVECEIGTKIEIPITNRRYNLAMKALPRYFRNDGQKMSKWISALIKISESNDSRYEDSIQNTGFASYRFQKPKISYSYCGSDVAMQFNDIPSKLDMRHGKFSDWFSYESDNYFVAWKPPAASPKKRVRFFQNGFRFSTVTNKIEREFGCDMGYPLFSADDPFGSFECDLARDRITLPNDFILELFRYKISLLFGLDVKRTLIAKRPIRDLFFDSRYLLMLGEKGYTLSNHMFLGHAKVKEYYIHNCRKLSCFATTNTELEIAKFGIDYITGLLERYNGTLIQALKGIAENNFLEASGQYYELLRKANAEDDNLLQTLEFYRTMFDEIAYGNWLSEGEKQLATLIEELIPFERNGGWIPYDMRERIKMYPEAFEHFWKMRYIKKTGTTEQGGNDNG